jgi:hypothetical protein
MGEQLSFAGARSNGEVAPISAIRATVIEARESSGAGFYSLVTSLF